MDPRRNGLDLGNRRLEVGVFLPLIPWWTGLRLGSEPVLENLDAWILADEMVQRRAARAASPG